MPRPGILAHYLRSRIHDAENLERLRNRGLAAKRSLALREFALGIEGLERFVAVNHFVACMNAYSACWRLKASRWILDFKTVNRCRPVAVVSRIESGYFLR